MSRLRSVRRVHRVTSVVGPMFHHRFPRSFVFRSGCPCTGGARSALLRVVREERDVHRGGLFEVVEVHARAGACIASSRR